MVLQELRTENIVYGSPIVPYNCFRLETVSGSHTFQSSDFNIWSSRLEHSVFLNIGIISAETYSWTILHKVDVFL